MSDGLGFDRAIKRLEKYYENPLDESEVGQPFILRVSRTVDWTDEQQLMLFSLLNTIASVDDTEYELRAEEYWLTTKESDALPERLKSELVHLDLEAEYDLSRVTDGDNVHCWHLSIL